MNSEYLYKLIGAKVRRIREAQAPRMSQEELAKVLDLKRTSITNIEKGIQKLTLDTIYRLCERFGLQISEFMPPVSAVTLSTERSIVVAGEAHEVGLKTASLVDRLRPDPRSNLVRSRRVAP